MKNNRLQRFLPIAAVLTAIGAAMWVLNWLTPYGGDDYRYMFMFFEGVKFDPERPIRTFGDILISQYNHWLGFNGRTVVHIIVQLFAGILGKPLFNICNAAVFVLFILAVVRLGMRKVSALNLLFAFAVVLLLWPGFGCTALWMSGSVNYIWASAAVCGFILALNRWGAAPLKAVHLLWCIPCLLAGWTHECFALPLAAGLGVWALTNRKTVFRQAALPMILSFAAGALLCSFAPSTIVRATVPSSVINLVDIAQRIAIGLRVCMQLKAIYVLAVVAVAVFFADRGAFRRRAAKFCRDNALLCYALAFSFFIAFAAKQTSSRVGAGTELFSILLLLRLAASVESRRMNIVKTVVCTVGAALYICILPPSLKNREDFMCISSQLENSRSEIILYNNYPAPPLLQSYITYNVDDGSFSPDSIYNKYIAAFYGRDSAAFISAAVYEEIVAGSDRLGDIARQSGYPYYVLPLGDDDRGRSPYFVLAPTEWSQLPLALRPARYIPAIADMLMMTKNELPVYQWHVFNIEGRDYIFMSKNHLVDDRVKEIIFK